MLNTIRHTASKSEGYLVRVAQYDGREYIVVPVVGLVQGVVHAMNAENPELVLSEEFSQAPAGWNGRPIFYGHPERGGVQVSGNSPDVLEQERIGIVFNTAIRKNKLTMEAWIDVVLAEARAPELLARARAGKAIEISVGAFVNTDDEVGNYEGQPYVGAWHDIVPDHLALLPAGDTGACSIDMGCGVRAAKGTFMEHMYFEWLEPGAETDTLLKTLRNIPQSERDKMPAENFAGPNMSFPIMEPGDVAAAASSLGRAKGDRNAIKRKIISIAYRLGDSYVSQLPEDWKKQADQKVASGGLLARMMKFIKTLQTPSEMSGSDLMMKLSEALREVEPNLAGCVTYFPVNDPSHVVYECWEPSGAVGSEYGMGYTYTMYERAFELSDAGTVTVNAARFEVQPVVTYEPVEGAQPTVAKVKDAAAGEPCRCQQHENSPEHLQEKAMNKTERVKALIAKYKTNKVAVFTDADQAFLEAASDDQLTRFEAAAVEVKVEPVVAAAAAVVETKTEATFESLLASADPATRDAINEGKRIGEERKAATIAALKATSRCKITDEKLKAMSQAELDQLVELAGAPKVAIDNTGRGIAVDREEGGDQPVADMPDLGDAIKANREAKK